jgi:hypothetical protein
VAVVFGVGVWEFAVSLMTSVADNTDRMIKVRLTELFDEFMEPSWGVAPRGGKSDSGRNSGFQPDMFAQAFCLGFSAG